MIEWESKILSILHLVTQRYLETRGNLIPCNSLTHSTQKGNHCNAVCEKGERHAFLAAAKDTMVSQHNHISEAIENPKEQRKEAPEHPKHSSLRSPFPLYQLHPDLTV